MNAQFVFDVACLQSQYRIQKVEKLKNNVKAALNDPIRKCSLTRPDVANSNRSRLHSTGKPNRYNTAHTTSLRSLQHLPTVTNYSTGTACSLTRPDVTNSNRSRLHNTRQPNRYNSALHMTSVRSPQHSPTVTNYSTGTAMPMSMPMLTQQEIEDDEDDEIILASENWGNFKKEKPRPMPCWGKGLARIPLSQLPDFSDVEEVEQMNLFEDSTLRKTGRGRGRMKTRGASNVANQSKFAPEVNMDSIRQQCQKALPHWSISDNILRKPLRQPRSQSVISNPDSVLESNTEPLDTATLKDSSTCLEESSDSPTVETFGNQGYNSSNSSIPSSRFTDMEEDFYTPNSQSQLEECSNNFQTEEILEDAAHSVSSSQESKDQSKNGDTRSSSVSLPLSISSKAPSSSGSASPRGCPSVRESPQKCNKEDSNNFCAPTERSKVPFKRNITHSLSSSASSQDDNIQTHRQNVLESNNMKVHHQNILGDEIPSLKSYSTNKCHRNDPDDEIPRWKPYDASKHGPSVWKADQDFPQLGSSKPSHSSNGADSESNTISKRQNTISFKDIAESLKTENILQPVEGSDGNNSNSSDEEVDLPSVMNIFLDAQKLIDTPETVVISNISGPLNEKDIEDLLVSYNAQVSAIRLEPDGQFQKATVSLRNCDGSYIVDVLNDSSPFGAGNGIVKCKLL